MGCSYTGSAGGAIEMDTPNCANEAAGMASIRTASNSKRIVCILNHLARSSFDCPVLPCCCGLRGLRGLASSARVPRMHCQVCAFWITFGECPRLQLRVDFPAMTTLAPERKPRPRESGAEAIKG